MHAFLKALKGQNTLTQGVSPVNSTAKNYQALKGRNN